MATKSWTVNEALEELRQRFGKLGLSKGRIDWDGTTVYMIGIHEDSDIRRENLLLRVKNEGQPNETANWSWLSI